MKLHDIIRKLRQQKEMTQENLADELGVDKTTIVRYEKDAGKIPIAQVEKIADVFGLSLPELLSYQGKTSIVEEPIPTYTAKKKRSLTVSIELDGEKETLNYWIDRMRKVNAALA